MPPKNHGVSGNDPIYELLGIFLQNINEAIVFCSLKTKLNFNYVVI
jgi:hypothetical protein